MTRQRKKFDREQKFVDLKNNKAAELTKHLHFLEVA